MTWLHLDPQAFQSLPWHDAAIFGIGTEQHDDGIVDLFLRCCIHPDEQNYFIQNLSINTPHLTIWFRNMSDLQLTIITDTSHRESIGEWMVALPSSVGRWPQYHITGTAGSTLDLYAETVWLEEHHQ
jgi:hypothetical protein